AHACHCPRRGRDVQGKGRQTRRRRCARRLRERRPDGTVAARLGVTILAGTDMYPPGSIWREVAALQGTDLDPARALAAASTTARAFLGEPALEEGAPPTSSSTSVTRGTTPNFSRGLRS